MTTTIGVIGAGYWGANYLRVFSELPDARLLAVADKDPARLEAMHQRYPAARLEPAPEVVLSAADVAAVVISTEAATHYSLARAGLLAGKHVLVEKPLALSVHECADLVSIASARNLTLMVGHTFVYNPAVRKMKEYMGGIGSVYYVHATRTNMGPIRRDVNVVWDLTPHDISIFNYLLGQHPEWVSAAGSRLLPGNQEDVAFIVLGYKDGILGHIHASWADPNKVRQLVVVGSERRIVFDDLSTAERLRVFERGVRARAVREADSYGEFLLLGHDGDIISPYVQPDEPLKVQCREFLSAVRDRRPPFTSGIDGAVVTQVICAINESLNLRGAPVPVEPVEALLHSLRPSAS